MTTNPVPYKSRIFCCEKCLFEYIVKETHTKFPNGSNYIECNICSYRAITILKHLKFVHKIKTEDYKAQYKCEVVSEKYKDFFSEKFQGEKNPGFNHQGRLSPFSKNFINFSEENFRNVKEKSKMTKKENPQNENTHLEYYTSRGFSEEEAIKLRSERQHTFSKQKCIENYGDEEGVIVWKERQEK